MELNELIEKLNKESNNNVPNVRDKVVTRAKAEGLLELERSSDTVTYNNGSSASLAARKKGWIAAIASAFVLAIVCIVLALAVIFRGAESGIPPTGDGGDDTPPAILPPEGEKEKSDRELGNNYAAGVVSTSRLMENFLPESEPTVKPVALGRNRARAKAAAVAMPEVNYISDFNGYLNAFGTFFGEELAYSADVVGFDSDKYDNCISVGGMLANGDPVSYNFYYSEYRVIGSQSYYLEGGIDLGNEHYRKQFVVIGERTYEADATAETSLQLCIYPNFNDKNTYGKMELEYAADGDQTLTKYSYTVISGGKTVDEVKAYRPNDGSAAFVIETKDGENNGSFSVGKATGGSFGVNFTLGAMTGNFSVVQTSQNKYKYNNVLMGQFTFNLNDDNTCVLTGYDKRTNLPENITIPDSCDGYKVVGIGQSAFYNCQDIKSVTIPESVTSIESSAFGYCGNLEEVKLPGGIKTISSSTFYNCSTLKTVNLPEGLTEIGYNAFMYCGSLESIAFPETLERIKSAAFKYCGRLMSLNITASVKLIDSDAFMYCSGMETLTVESGNSVYKSVDNCIIEVAEKSLALGCKNSIIPADGSVTKIGQAAFGGCRDLFAIEIPYGIIEIENAAFIDSGLQHVDLPDSVVTIYSAAFDNCNSLVSAHIPSSVQRIIDNPFRYCDKLDTLTVASGNNYYTCKDWSDNECNCIISTADKRLISGCQNTTIPADGNVVVTIGPEAFIGQYNLNAIRIPANITDIEFGAFQQCRSLNSVDIEYGLRYIGNRAFYDSGLSRIELPDSVEAVDMSVFEFCYNLREVVLSSNMTVITDRLFYECNALYSIQFNNGCNIRAIANEAFWGCHGLSFSIPDNCMIAPLAFAKSGIHHAVIPKGDITWEYPDGNNLSIADSAFKYCGALRYVDIGKNIRLIENQVFYDCTNLIQINYAGTMEQWKAIDKGAGWDYNTGDYKVICSDGTLDKNGSVVVTP